MGWEKKETAQAKQWYFVVNGKPFAMIEKFADTRSTKNPFKVLINTNGKFEPDAAFWPKAVPFPANVGYFKDFPGGLGHAMERVQNLAAKK